MPASERRSTEQKKLAGIFISYRRTDNPDATGRIYDRLVSEFGKSRVFKDVDSIPLGQDFRSHLNGIVGDCAAVLAIIGPKWTDTRNARGTRRLEDPDDFVRIELEAALARDIPVVPVLVGHAPMPGSTELPGSLASMAYRQSIEVRPDPDFHHDATRLVSALKAIIDPDARESPGEGATAATVRPSTPDGSPKVWRKYAWLIALAGVLVPLVTTFVIPAAKSLRAPPAPEMRTDIATPFTEQPRSFALSPDGRMIAYVANSDGVSRLWLRSFSATTAQLLPGTEGAGHPFWSPDSRSIAFPAGGALKRLDLGGGQPQTLAAVHDGTGGGSWSTAGVILFKQSNFEPLMRVAATGGTSPELVKLPPEVGTAAGPIFLPDGQRFLFGTINAPKTGIYIGALDDRAPILLTKDSARFSWTPTGWLIWLRAGALVAQKLDTDKGTLTGEPVTVADGINAVSASAATGLVAYRAGAVVRRQQLTWFDRAGGTKGSIGDPDETLDAPRIARDGRVSISRQSQGNADIWILDGARASRMTFDKTNDGFAVWSPDGAQIAFSSEHNRNFDLFRKSTNGAGVEELLVHSDQSKVPTSWSTDGRYLLYFSVDPKNSPDLWVLPMTGERKPYVLLKTAFTEAMGQFSPDGKWVAYESDETGRYEIYVRPFVPPAANGSSASAPQGQWAISTAGGVHPVWRADGKEIYYISPQGEMMAAPISTTGSTFVPGIPIKLFATRIVGGGIQAQQVAQFDVAKDGRFLINTELDSSTVPPITLLQNWNPAGK